MKKLTEDFIKEQFIKKGYNLIGEYKNSQTPCLIEKDGYRAYIQYNNFYMGKMPSFFSLNNPFFKENIVRFISQKDSSIEVLNIEIIIKSKRKRILVIMRCSCGEKFFRVWDDVYSNKYLRCNKCAIVSRGRKHRKDKGEALKLFEQKGYKILSKTNDFVRNKMVEVENKKGYRGFISYNRLLSDRNISIFDIRTNEKNYIYNINNYAKQQGIKTIAIGYSDNQKWTTRGIKFICSCGKEYETSIISFQSGKILCDECSKKSSRYERVVQKFLEDNCIKYISQFRINSCRDILPLPFDFYVCELNKIIEVDGEGHYYPCHFNQISHEDAIKAFKMTKKHDAIKNEYCKKYNISLLRVSYKDFIDDIYKEKIMQFIEN